MDVSLCRSLLEGVGKRMGFAVVEPSEQERDFVVSAGMPVEFTNVICAGWPQSHGSGLPFSWMPLSEQIADAPTRNLSRALLDDKLFYIGWLSDTIVVDFATEDLAVYYISGTEWGGAGCGESPRKYMEKIAPSFDVFLYRLVEEKFIPDGYWAAKRYREVKERDAADK